MILIQATGSKILQTIEYLSRRCVSRRTYVPTPHQVVGWESKGKIIASELQSMATALCQTSIELCKILGQESLKQDLVASHLDQAGTWLDQVAVKVTRLLLGTLLDAKRTHGLANAKLAAIKMPGPHEDSYKKAGVKHVGHLADLSRAVEEDVQKMKDLRSAMSKLKSSKFSLNGDGACAVLLGEWQQKHGWDPLQPIPGDTESLVTCKISMFHVAAVAAKCLVRSEAIQGGSPDAKTLKNLQDIAVTLQTKCDCLPDEETDLKKHGGALVEECESFYKGSSKRKSTSAAEKLTAKVHKVAPKPETEDAVTPSGQILAATSQVAADKEKTPQGVENTRQQDKDMSGQDNKDKKEKDASKKEKKNKKEKKEKKDKKNKKKQHDKKEKKDKTEKKEKKEKEGGAAEAETGSKRKKEKEVAPTPKAKAKALAASAKAEPKAKGGGRGRGRGRGRGQ